MNGIIIPDSASARYRSYIIAYKGIARGCKGDKSVKANGESLHSPRLIFRIYRRNENCISFFKIINMIIGHLFSNKRTMMMMKTNRNSWLMFASFFWSILYLLQLGFFAFPSNTHINKQIAKMESDFHRTVYKICRKRTFHAEAKF